MKNKLKYMFMGILMSMIFLISGCEALVNLPENQPMDTQVYTQENETELVEGEYYYELEEVAEYIHIYEELPDNYITKSEANQMGWTPEDDTYVVGGDRFGNREGRLPKAQNRQYYEADVQAGYTHHRGPERIVYSDDGLIFYTDDHYDSFEQLY